MVLKLVEQSDAPLQTLNFDPDFPVAGSEATVIGYGATSEGGSGSPNLLMTTNFITSQEECFTYFDNFGSLPIVEDLQICLGGMDGISGQDACSGDR